jgi:hypothetical protein
LTTVSLIAIGCGAVVGCGPYLSAIIPPSPGSFKVIVTGNNWVEWNCNIASDTTSRDIVGSGDLAVSIVESTRRLGVSITKKKGTNDQGVKGHLSLGVSKDGTVIKTESFLQSDPDGTTKTVVLVD